MLGGARGIADVVAFGLGAFVLASIGRSVVVGVRARRRATAEALPVAAVHTVRGNPRLYGGLLVHVGVVVLAIALATTSGYTTKREVQLAARAVRDRARVHRHLPAARRPTVGAQKTTIEATCGCARGSSSLGTFHPAISSFPNFPDGIGTPAIHSDPWHDVYLTLVSAPNAGSGGGPVTIGVQVGTFVMWLWIGGVIMALGILLALTPTRRRRRDRRDRAARRRRAARAGRGGDVSDTRVISRHRARWIALTVAVVLVAFGVVLAVQHRTEASVPRLVQEHKPAPSFEPHHARRQADQLAVARGQDLRRELLELVVHPVPAGGARARRRSTPRTRASPTSRWSASSATTTPSPIRELRRGQRDHVAGRVRSERQRRARLRHDRSTRDVRDRARPASRCAAVSGPSPTPSSRRGSQIVRAGGVCG